MLSSWWIKKAIPPLGRLYQYKVYLLWMVSYVQSAVKASPSWLLLWFVLGLLCQPCWIRGEKEKTGLVFQNVSRVMRVRWSYDTRTKKRITRCSFALFFPLTPLLLTACTGSSLSSKRSWVSMFRATHTEAKDGHEHPQQTRKIMTDILLWLKLLLFLLPQRPVLPE